MVVRTTAAGHTDVPEAEDFAHVWDFFSALFRFGLVALVTAAPLFVYVNYIKADAPLVEYVTDPWVYVAILLGLLWTPMAFMQAVMAQDHGLLAVGKAPPPSDHFLNARAVAQGFRAE